VEQNCIKALCDILVCPDLRIILVSLGGLEMILIAGEVDKNLRDVNCYSQMIEDAEGLEKIENLQHHGNNEIYEKAVKILQTYGLVEEDGRLVEEEDEGGDGCSHPEFQFDFSR